MTKSCERFPICLAVFIILVLWTLIWPDSGEGDAILHYRNFREGALNPEVMLTAWARPLYAALMFVPAMGGVLAVRIWTAFFSAILVWQTMRLADDLELPNSTLAGLMVFWQPYAFALAADTMTEMPMALGIVLAFRLWLARRFASSLLLVSFLPMVRPEGFFMMLVWSVMLLLPRVTGLKLGSRLRHGVLLGVGLFCWIVACVLIVEDPYYVIRSWSWPPGSIVAYGSGRLFDYAIGWPEYCGPVLLPLFLIGIVPSSQKKMLLPWVVWLTVFVVHSFLWWRGWFASLGLLRILACTSPLTALVCLYGWNAIASSRALHAWSSRMKVGIRVFVFLLATAYPMIFFVNKAENRHPAVIRQAVDYLQAHCELEKASSFFTCDQLVLALLDYPYDSEQLKCNLPAREKQLDMLVSLPAGSLGVWDNYRGKYWFNVEIDELPVHGYEILFETDRTLRGIPIYGIGLRHWPKYQRCVVVRKLREPASDSGR